MSNYTIKEVLSSKDELLFLNVVDKLYQNDANYVRPLDVDLKNVFDRHKNERYIGGDAKRWIALDGDKTVGRIAAFYNTDEAKKEKQLTGGVGFFEAIDNQEVANMLFDTAKNWLTEQGMQAMDGSINFGDRLNWWGVLVDGFSQPVYGMSYNLPYYGQLFENYGFQNYFNQHTYRRELNPEIAMEGALYEKAMRVLSNPEYCVKHFDPKNKEKMAHDFMTVYNSGWAKFEGVKQLNIEHTRALLKTMSPIIDPEILFFAYHNDVPIGFFVMVPDINQIIAKFNGKLGLINKLRLVCNLKCKKSVNRAAGLIFGVAAEYQGKGIETALIKSFEIYVTTKINFNKKQYETLEMCWVGDFNPVMMRMCEGHVKGHRYKRHVTFRYIFDRNEPFERCPRMGSKPKDATPKTPKNIETH